MRGVGSAHKYLFHNRCVLVERKPFKPLPFAGIPARRHAPQSIRGFTLLELMLAVALVAIMSVIAIPTYRSIVKRMEVTTAVEDLQTIATRIERYRSLQFRLPVSLSELPDIPAADPWGLPYEYLNFDGASNGHIRKDHNLHPLNSEYDLYSKGPDGESRSPLTARASRDDIIWARDGSFVGKAEDF